MRNKIVLLSLLMAIVSVSTAIAQPRIASMVRSSDGGGSFVEVDTPNCFVTEFAHATPYDGDANRIFWFYDQVHQPALNNQTKVYMNYPYSPSGQFAVYVYPNANLNPNNYLSWAISYASGTTTIANKYPQITGCGNSEFQNFNRCMQAYVVTSEPTFDWYVKVGTNWVSTLANLSHLFVPDGRCKEYKVDLHNPANASGLKSYAHFHCMVGNACSHCTGNYTVTNQSGTIP